VPVTFGSLAAPNSAFAESLNPLLQPGEESNVGVGQTITETAILASSDSSPVTVTALGLYPSCNSDPCDPSATGVFSVESAVGEPAADSPGCPGVAFAVTGPDPPTGPNPGLFTLAPPAPLVVGRQPGDVCRVDITLRALKLPPFDANPTVPGLQVKQFLVATEASGATVRVEGTDAITVSQPSPTLAVEATASATVGKPITATATVSGLADGPVPTGNVHFALYPPTDSTCGTAATSFDAPLDSAGHATSPSFTDTALGTYTWVASYGGDDNYASASTACNDPGTTSEVTGAPTTLELAVASASAVPGQAISATATLGGGSAPTGSIGFGVWRNNAACAGSPDFTSTATVDQNGDYVSDQFIANDPGTYRFTASYSGDTTNTPVATTCDDPGTSVVVSVPGDVLPTITLDSAASTASLPAPGGTFTFHVTITNTSTEPLTTKTLVDSVYGDLAGKGSCKVDVPLAAAGGPGDSYTCSYTGDFKGAAGATQAATIKATAVDGTGNEAPASHDTKISLSAPPSTATTTTTTDPPATTVAPDPAGSGATGGGGPLAFTGVGVTGQLRLGIGCVLTGLLLVRRRRRRAEPPASVLTRQR
jgi:hypothetical protein